MEGLGGNGAEIFSIQCLRESIVQREKDGQNEECPVEVSLASGKELNQYVAHDAQADTVCNGIAEHHGDHRDPKLFRVT